MKHLAIRARRGPRRRGRPAVGLVLVGALLSLFLALPLHAQSQPRVTFNTDQPELEKDVVKSYFTVWGQNNFPITDLQKEQVTVTEDGNAIHDFTLAPDNTPSDIVVALDASNSMGLDVKVRPIYTPRMNIAKDAAKELAQALLKPDIGNRIMVGWFNEAWLLQPNNSTFTDNKMVVQSQVDYMETPDINKKTGGTCLYDAAYKALQVAATSLARSKVVVLLTDGREQQWVGGQLVNGLCSEKTIDEVIAFAQAARIPLYTVGMSLDKNLDSAALARLAVGTGGQSVVEPDVNQLSTVFKNIATKLQGRYVLQYQSNADNHDHQLEITVRPSTNVNGGAPLSGRQMFLMPDLPPRSITVTVDPVQPDKVTLQGKVRFTAVVEPRGRAGKVVYQVNGPNPVEFTAPDPPYTWEWDTTALAGAQGGVPVTLEVRAYSKNGTASLSDQSFAFNIIPAPPTLPPPTPPPTPGLTPQPPRGEDVLSPSTIALFAIGVGVIITMLLTLFMFLSRGRGGAIGPARKPASVTKGEPLATLVVVEGPGVGKPQEHFLYGDPRTGIGREEDQPIQLPGERVSRQHGEILHRRNQFMYNEIKAANGTTVDGQPVSQGTPVILHDGSEIVFGGQTRAIFKRRAPAMVVSPLTPGHAGSERTVEWVRGTASADVTIQDEPFDPSAPLDRPLSNPRIGQNGSTPNE